jgi:hypothetical protein
VQSSVLISGENIVCFWFQYIHTGRETTCTILLPVLDILECYYPCTCFRQVPRAAHGMNLFRFSCFRIQCHTQSKTRDNAYAMDPQSEAITVAEYQRHARVLRKRAERTRRAVSANTDRLHREAFAMQIAARAAAAEARRQGQETLTRLVRLGSELLDYAFSHLSVRSRGKMYSLHGFGF